MPFDLLRVGDLSNSTNTTQLTSGIGARTRTRCAVDVIGGGSAGQQQASCYYEVVGNKARNAISHRCRLGLDYIIRAVFWWGGQRNTATNRQTRQSPAPGFNEQKPYNYF